MPSGDNTNVSDVISRGQIDTWMGDSIQRSKKKKTLGTPDHECMQDTDQEQPAVQLETSDDYIPIHERKWKHIIASAYSHKYMWKSQISNVQSRLVGT